MSTFLKVFIKLPIVVALLFLPVSLACGAVNYPIPQNTVHYISYGTVMHGIELAIKFAESGLSPTLAGVLQNGDKYVIWFSLKRGIGFIGIDATTKSLFDVSKQIFSGGNYTQARSVRELLKVLQDAGWVATSQVPQIVKDASKLLQDVTKASTNMLSTGGRSLVTIFVLPLETVEDIECFPACTENQ